MSKELLFGKDVKEKLASGVTKLAKAVKTTLGPKGRNVIIEKMHGYPVITKDGVSVANEISFKDKYENLGAQIIKVAAGKTADTAGDGTTTATVLAEAIYSEGLKKIAVGYNPVQLKNGIDKAVEKITNAIDEVAKPITNDADLDNIATISVNGDKELGKLISTAIKSTGKDGNITVEDSPTFDCSFETVKGVQYNRGYISQYFINDPKKLRCVLNDPLILIHEKKISSLDDIFEMLQIARQQNKPLFIIAEDIEGEALTTLIINNAKKIINVCAVKNPGYGLKQRENLTDIALHTGGKCICLENNVTLKTAGMQHLGTAKQVIVTRDSFTIVEGGGVKSLESQQHIEELRFAIENAPNDLEKNNLKDRLAKMTDGVGVIKIGGVTEAEIKEKKDRVDDAIHAVKAAIAEGIIPGGGVTLAKIQKMLTSQIDINTVELQAEEIAGMNIVINALSAPLLQICQNAGISGDVILNHIQEIDDNDIGYDINTGNYVDMINLGIIDPAKVTKTALRSAASAAGMLLTTECAVVNISEE